MNTLRVRLPNSLHQQMEEWAKREGTSVDQLIASAVAEKLSALATVEYLESRGQRGSREAYEAALQSVPDVEPEAFDQLPSQKTPKKRRPNSKRKK